MLSLGPGSACDVCLEPFGAELKAPCSISCGHVFCVNCLQHIARPTCPLCRTPFQMRHTVKLHVDLDSIRAPAASDGMPLPADSDEGARQLHKRITGVASEGATEAQTTQLTEECKAFLSTVPKTMYSELRTAYRMLCYMCQVKRNFVEQGRTVNQLMRNATTASQDVDRLKASIEALKLEKRNWEQAWQSVSAEKDELSVECSKLHEQLHNADAQILFLSEQNETAQNQLVLLNEEIQRLRSQREFSSSEGDFSSPDGDSPQDLPQDFPPSIASDDRDWQQTNLAFTPGSDDQDPAAPFLTPWGGHSGLTEMKSLPDADLSEPPVPVRVLCGAAGCPHSCDCMPFQLFSPASREAAAAADGRAATSDAPPSGISALFAPGAQDRQDRSRSRSRSPSYPRSRSLSRTPPPSNLATPPSMSASINIPPNGHQHQHHEMRGQLMDLLRDPPVSTSLPNMSFARYGASSSLHPASSKERLVAAMPGRPTDTYLHPPMLNHSRNPSPLHGGSPLAESSHTQPHRPSLYRASSSASSTPAREKRDHGKEQRRERAAAAAASPRVTPPLGGSAIYPLSHSSTPSPRASESSRFHGGSEPNSILGASIKRRQTHSGSPGQQASSQAGPHAYPTPTTTPPTSAYGPGPPSPPPQPLPRAQAHLNSPRPDTKPSSPLTSSAMRSSPYVNPGAPAPSVAVDSRTIYAMPAASASSRARQADAPAARGTSKRTTGLLPAMTTAQNVLLA